MNEIRRWPKLRLFLGPLVLSGLLLAPVIEAAEVNVYSARKEALIKPLFDQFTTDTGIQVNLVTGRADALLQRLIREGANTPADMLLTVDAGRLHRAQQAGVLSPVNSKTLIENIPSQYRSPDNTWFGLSLRTRTVVYAKDRVKKDAISSYNDLALPRWKHKLCVRSSNNIYNQSMIAAQIAHHGVQHTESWTKALVANFARPPQGGDRDQIRAVAAGQCDVALVNSYYLAQMINSNREADRKAAGKVELLWLDQAAGDNGAHVNISGAGLTQAAGNRDNAIRLLEYLSAARAQQWYANTNYEFPVMPGVSVGKTLQDWGAVTMDQLPLIKLGEHNADAVRLMDRVGWK